MVTDKELLKEVSKELWNSVKKLRPDLPQEARIQLVLKALITIGDLANPIEAAMVIGNSLELEASTEDEASQQKQQASSIGDSSSNDERTEARRTVRRRSSTNQA